MRARTSGGSLVVSVSESDVRSFCRSWPASGLSGLRGVTFEFDRGGDLVDITYRNGTSDRWDGPALLALSHDAQAYGRSKLKLVANRRKKTSRRR